MKKKYRNRSPEIELKKDLHKRELAFSCCLTRMPLSLAQSLQKKYRHGEKGRMLNRVITKRRY